MVHPVERHARDAALAGARPAGGARALPAPRAGREGAACRAARAVRAADRRGRRRVPSAGGGERAARVPRPRRHAGRDHRGPGVLQRLGRDPGRRRRVGVARPATRRGRGGPRRDAGAGAAHRDPARPPAGDRVGGQRRLPVLRHVLRRGAHPGRTSLQLGRDRDLPAHHPAARPAGGGRAVGPAAARGHRAAARGRTRPSYGRPLGVPGRVAVAAADPRRRTRPGRDRGPGPARGRADPRPGRRLAAQRRRLEPGELPGTRLDRRAAGAGRPGHRGTGHVAAHRRRRHVDVPAARPDRRRRRDPALADDRRTSRAHRPRRRLHAAARSVGGDARLRFPDHPRRTAARPARLAAPGADRPGAGGPSAGGPHARTGARRRRLPAARGRGDPRRLAAAGRR